MLWKTFVVELSFNSVLGGRVCFFNLATRPRASWRCWASEAHDCCRSKAASWVRRHYPARETGTVYSWVCVNRALRYNTILYSWQLLCSNLMCHVDSVTSSRIFLDAWLLVQWHSNTSTYRGPDSGNYLLSLRWGYLERICLTHVEFANFILYDCVGWRPNPNGDKKEAWGRSTVPHVETSQRLAARCKEQSCKVGENCRGQLEANTQIRRGMSLSCLTGLSNVSYPFGMFQLATKYWCTFWISGSNY